MALLEEKWTNLDQVFSLTNVQRQICQGVVMQSSSISCSYLLQVVASSHVALTASSAVSVSVKGCRPAIKDAEPCVV